MAAAPRGVNMKNLTDDGKEFKTTIINFKDKQIFKYINK